MEVDKPKFGDDQSLSPYISEVDNFFGDPQVLPRVGEEYQAKVLPLIPSDGDLTSKPRWTSLKDERNKEGVILPNNVCSVLQADGVNTQLVVENCLENSHKLNLGDGSNNLPSLSSWGDADYNSFLLGLYTFGKDFNLIKRFVESKQMGDILLFYYGKFYGSSGFRRWSDCRKVKSRRCVSGQKIYSGWRLQELLSRVSSRVSVVSQTLLIEASRMFEQGSTPFEDFVFALKEMVGLSNLVAAVGIGTGKQDLTNTAESSRKYNALPARPEIPVGEAWSSLSLGEILKFLRGDFRLSKARSNDLFWEAVWPRLLAKGWHSEQPKEPGVSGSKHSLVFLIPGIQEFARDSLVKGNDYFDSVTDILNKVASDPVLLELQREADGVMPAEGLRNKPSTAPDMNGVMKRPSRQYLQPRIPKGDFSSVMFMIVDTSLINQGKTSVRELRHLPVELMDVAANPFRNHRKRRDPCDVSKVEADSLDRRTSSETSSCFTPVDADKSKSCHEEDVKKLRPKLLKKPRKNWEMKSSGHLYGGIGIKTEQKNSASLLAKPKKAEVDDFSGRKIHKLEPSRGTSSHFKSKEMVLSLAASYSFPKKNLLPDCSKDETKSTTQNNDSIRTMIDLNLPQVSSDPVAEEECSIPEGGPSCLTASPSPSEHQAHDTEFSNLSAAVELPSNNGRRQSTRNRPLTTRALEAIECGLLDMKKNMKRKKYTRKAPATYVEMSDQPEASDDGRVVSSADHKELVGHDNEVKATE
ncbi:hypothetical protein MLD38_012334 [Melastoma candidum]|uniref:Uncharacterized protein n=1 Tax=Melastoma candidum TaxID=119954 RepID=A0ACB9R7A5_9MYRT|nr:hypothetical protein MLD38_012334 [Melastoma candidum]